MLQDEGASITDTEASKQVVASEVSELDVQNQMGSLVSQPVLAPAFYSPYYPCTNLEQYHTATASNTNANPTTFRSDPPIVNTITEHTINENTKDPVVVESTLQLDLTQPSLSTPHSPLVGDQQRKMSCEDHQCSSECQCQRLLVSDSVSVGNVRLPGDTVSSVDAPDCLTCPDGNDLDQVTYSASCLLYVSLILFCLCFFV